MTHPTRRALVSAVLALLLAAPLLGASPSPGRYDVLGEDGVVFVPDSPPTAAYLPPPDLGPYHNAEETVTALQALAAARPDLFTVAQIGTSVQGRPILMATLTAPGDASERPRVLFDGAHHGDEVIGSEILTRFLQNVKDTYDANATLQAILANVVLHVVPQVNPDGIAKVPTCTYYADCRKNANAVDLNRNYPDHWGGSGSSGSPSSPTYRGPSPASEPETQAVKALMDAHDYVLYASLHSGADMILWPYGWTTTSPPEVGVYQQLGNELSAKVSSPNGQVSKILYAVSGDSMDQAYGSADGWRAIAISPETYEGSGNAYDWWYLFNPPETQIATHVARWSKFLWHLAAVAPLYAPARVDVAETVVIGPAGGDLAAVVTAPERRPLVGASLQFNALAAPVTVSSPNPFPLLNVAGPQSASFTLQPTMGGDFASELHLHAGPAGYVKAPVDLHLVQFTLTASVGKPTLGSPDTQTWQAGVDAGPYDLVEGTLTLRILPEGTVLMTTPFAATPGSPASFAGSFPVADLAGGAHAFEASAAFTATDDTGTESGTVVSTAGFFVERPDVAVTKSFKATTRVGDPLLVTVNYRNVGTMAATKIIVRETVPPGYAFTMRDGPVPVPLQDPLAKPAPTRIEARDDGGLDLVWEIPSILPTKGVPIQYRILPLAPGEHQLPSSWTYEGAYATGTVDYGGSASFTHHATLA